MAHGDSRHPAEDECEKKLHESDSICAAAVPQSKITYLNGSMDASTIALVVMSMSVISPARCSHETTRNPLARFTAFEGGRAPSVTINRTVYKNGLIAVLAWHCCATANQALRAFHLQPINQSRRESARCFAYVDDRREVRGAVQLHVLNRLRIRRQQPGYPGDLWVGVVAVEREGVADGPLRRELGTVAEGQKLSARIVTEVRFRR